MKDTEVQIESVKQNNEGLIDDEVQKRVMELERQCDENTSELNSLFAKIDERKRVSWVLFRIDFNVWQFYYFLNFL